MGFGKHICNKSVNNPRYHNKYSGVSYAPHSRFYCPDCGEQLHNENYNYYCPRCDEYKSIRSKYLKNT